MTISAPVRQHVTPLVLRQHAHLRRIREGSARRIRQAFGQARDQARPHIAQFTDAYGAELARRRREAEDATVSLVWLAGFLALLYGPLTRSVSQATLIAQGATIASQTQAINDGQHDGWQQVQQIAENAAVTAALIALSRYGISGYNGSALSSFYAQMAQQAWQKAQTAAMAAAANGASAESLLTALEAGFDSSASRALLIDETEIMLGYRDGLFASFAANPAFVAGWMWSALGPDPCPECEANNGQVFAMEEEFDSHPRCWCVPIPLSPSDLLSL